MPVKCSYFDKELCLDRHYIITGFTNDVFASNDGNSPQDVRYELHRYLRHEQGFDAVIFFDLEYIYCYDKESCFILRGGDERNISRDIKEPYRIRKDTIEEYWKTFIHLISKKTRCAIVFANVDAVSPYITNDAVCKLEELPSIDNNTIVIYMCRETNVASLFDSLSSSAGGAWSRLLQNVLLPRIDTKNPTVNRVISLYTPNSLEIENFLNYMRQRRDKPLLIAMEDLEFLKKTLAASCARQKISLKKLQYRFDDCISKQPNRELNKDNWKDFTGELGYLSPMEKLEQLIGMCELKNKVKQWVAEQKQNSQQITPKTSFSRFAPTIDFSKKKGHALNIVLKGNPGTGKTTVARLFGMIYYDLSFLPQGHLVECSAATFVSSYVGDTARVVRERVQEAMGGVLFIDEAYSLTTNEHGKEAINQLVNDMSTYEGQFAVVLAGYPDSMDEFMKENEGLSRRFPNQFILPDYSAKEMQQILAKMIKDDGFTVSSSLSDKLPSFCEAWVGGKTRGWGNAGEAEKLLEKMKGLHGERLQSLPEESSNSREFTIDDIPIDLQHCLKPHSLEEVMNSVNNMIGLKNVKVFLNEVYQNIICGVENVPGNYIFFGAPGTGKTMVARLLGEILGHLGVLRRKVNNVIECKAAELLNGQKQLRDIVKDARGGVLFIDEAHQLEQSSEGHRIIRELVPIIEDPVIHSDTCFICAGYTVEMKKFLEIDRGLSRRFPLSHRIRFDDYAASELVEILKKMAEQSNAENGKPNIVTENYLIRSKRVLEKYMEHRPANFGNAGFIRDVYLPNSISARTDRLFSKVFTDDAKPKNRSEAEERIRERFSEEEQRTLTAEDIPRDFLCFAPPTDIAKNVERNADTLLKELYGKEEIIDYAKSFNDEDDEVFYDEFVNVGFHYSIVGNNGTGKHTAIKAIATKLNELGLLEKDDVVFVGKAELEAGYVGQTAIKTQSVIEQAVGGTLVIQYPSTFLPQSMSDNSFGPEALGVVVGAMGEHFTDLCVVFLDTEKGMRRFLTFFPQCTSLLKKQFVLGDLEATDMFEIFNLKTKNNMQFDDDIAKSLSHFFSNWCNARLSKNNWGNGNEIDRLIDSIKRNWRHTEKEKRKTVITDEGLKKRYITKEMFPLDLQEYFVTKNCNEKNE